MIQLGAAYETLSDENRRTKYDVTLASSRRSKQSPQPAWPPQPSSDRNDATSMGRESMRGRAWGCSSGAQERKDQARREDGEYWSGPKYFHGTTDRKPDPDWSDKMQKEYLERLERLKRAKQELSNRRKAEREQSDIAKLPLLLSKVISIQVDIVETGVKVDESRSAMKARDSRSDLPYLRLQSER